jgi:hypothetical protein
MEKKQAQLLIENTFNCSFNEERFTVFAKNLLNDIEPKSNTYSGNLIWDDYKEHINSYKRIGKYIDPEGEAIDVLIVEVKTIQKLERARTVLRNFVIKHLSKFEKDYALVAFYSKEDDGADWRFSFIKLEYRSELDVEKGKVKTKKEFTPAKRYSFLVGKYEKTHTAKNQLLPLLQNISNNPTIEELEAAFSIEKVTDEFFNQYKDLYVKLYEHFENDDSLQFELQNSGIDNNRFTKKLLGQIVFLYFLQKKGWLGVSKNCRWGSGNKRFVQELFNQANSEGVNFFKDKLQYLFYEALAKERDNENSFYERFNCRIPFLNGGLFEADYKWQGANITIPESLFRNEEKNKSGDIGTGILDVFGRYNFTIKEDEPLDKEVAVDPEMLGKVFENMLDIKERKSKGAFYTPREIVHYMCQESLIHYLDNALNNSTSTYQALDSDQLSFLPGSTDKKGNVKIEFEHKNNSEVPKKDIENYIRDGHFALENDERVAAKGETKTYKYQLPESIRLNADLIDQKLSDIRICDPAIGSGAFPVGILHELVNAMLVLKPHFSDEYLSKKLKSFSIPFKESYSESRYIYRLKRHIIQESIYGVDIDASAIDIARLRLWLSLVVDEDDLDPIETLPNLDYKIVCGNSLIGMPETAMRDLNVEGELEILKDKFYNVTNDTEKKALRLEINTKIKELLVSAEDYAGYKINFDFKLFFSEVWREKGGFDLVIGNPPYINIANIKDTYIRDFLKTNFEVSRNKSDLYSFFTEKGHRILKDYGVLYFIVSNSWLGTDSFLNFRKFLVNKTKMIDLVLCKGDVFDATVTPVIFGFIKSRVNDNRVPLHKLINGSFEELPNKINYNDIRKIPSFPFSFKNQIHIKAKSIKLGKIARFTLGIKTSNDKKFISDFEFEDNSYKMIRGKDISRFKTNFSNKFLWYKPELMLLKKGAGPRQIDYFLVREKIVIKDVANKIEATLDRNKYLTNDTLNSIYEVNGYSFNYILAILNSEVINVWYKNIFSSGLHVKLNELKEIPIAHVNKRHESSIVIIVEYLLALNHNISWDYFFSILNAVIYELYFPEEIKSADKEILKHLEDLKSVKDEMSEEEKLAIIQSEFERLYDPNHPVRFAIETLDSVEEVRIIKEALK